MPTERAGILICTLDELVPAHWPSYDSLQKAIKRSEARGYGLRRASRGGNGRELALEYDSLPAPVQSALGDPRKGVHVLEQFYTVDDATVRYYQEHGYIDDDKYQRNVTNACVLMACVRLLQAREAEIRSKGGKPKKVMEVLCADAQSFNAVLRQRYGSYHTLPECHRTFGRRMARWEAEGYQSMIHGQVGNANRTKVTGNVLDVFRSMFSRAGDKPTYNAVANRWEAFVHGRATVINETTGEQYDPKDFPALGRSTIYRYLSEWESKIGTDALRMGDRQKLINKHIPYANLDKPEHAGAILSVDDRQPPFKCTSDQRIWMYAGQDVASEAVTTWVFGLDKKGMILDFYRQMVRNYAEWGLCLPYELECESSLNSDLRHGVLRDGNMFTKVRIEANNARGKFIEQSFNKGVRYQEGYERGRKGYIHRFTNRDESNQAGPGEVPELPYDEIVEMELQLIDQWNNAEHSSIKGMSRWDVFLSRQHPRLSPINWRGILPYIGIATATSCHAGLMKMQNANWYIGDKGTICTGDALIDAMREIEGRDVTIYWMRGNDGKMLKALVYQGDRYICEAVTPPRPPRASIDRTPEMLAEQEAFNRYRSTIQGYQNAVKGSIDRVMVVNHTPKTIGSSFQHSGTVRQPVPDYSMPDILPDIDQEPELVTVTNGYATTDIATRF